MKPSHYKTPRGLDECAWHMSGEAYHKTGERPGASMASAVLACLMGVFFALYLVHWWAS